MTTRQYYSVRTGKHPTGGGFDLDAVKRLFLAIFKRFEADDYFQEGLGFTCVDEGYIEGTAGNDIEAFFVLKLKKQNLWPLESNIQTYSEDDLFDVMELLYDLVSKGKDGHNHSWSQCGMHYSTFDKATGRAEFRSAVNEILGEYSPPYQLSPEGEIVLSAPTGLEELENAPAPPGDKRLVQEKVEAARRKFRSRGATNSDRRDAVRDLADILEFMRKDLKEVLVKKDESDLFELANNFGIRHHNKKQKKDYDEDIWLSWMYYYYLTTIHAVTRIVSRKTTAK